MNKKDTLLKEHETPIRSFENIEKSDCPEGGKFYTCVLAQRARNFCDHHKKEIRSFRFINTELEVQLECYYADISDCSSVLTKILRDMAHQIENTNQKDID